MSLLGLLQKMIILRPRMMTMKRCRLTSMTWISNSHDDPDHHHLPNYHHMICFDQKYHSSFKKVIASFHKN